MSDLKETNEGNNAPKQNRSEPRALTAIERLRLDPNWRPGMDPTYSGFGLRWNEITQVPDLLPVQSPERNHADQRQVAWEEQLHRLSREVLPVGQRIRQLRLLLGWTQQDAAKNIGISRRTVIRHEKSDNRHHSMLSSANSFRPNQ